MGASLHHDLPESVGQQSMAYHIDDRWLWLGFGAFAILAARGIRLAIADLVELTKIDPRPDPKKLPPEDADPEDRRQSRLTCMYTPPAEACNRHPDRNPQNASNLA